MALPPNPRPTNPKPTEKKQRRRGRSLPPKPTVLSPKQCHFHQSGRCTLGNFCRYQHGWARPVYTRKNAVYVPKEIPQMVEEAINVRLPPMEEPISLNEVIKEAQLRPEVLDPSERS